MKSRHLMLPSVAAMVSVVVLTAAIRGGGDETKSISVQKATASQPKTEVGPSDTFSTYVDEDGKIRLPDGYKQAWTHLGSWAVAMKPGESVHEMHNVYTQPESIAAFNKTGEFPDGAVLVKEVRKTEADRLTTGHSAWSTDMKIWFVMIKDREERFSDSEHWGDGWGWALFEAKDPTKNVSAGYDTSCLACHVPAEDNDWVYVHGYPELKKLK